MKDQESKHEKIWEEINEIKSNHLLHLGIDMASVKSDVSWLKKNHFIVMTASVGALVGAIINLIK